MTQIAVASRPPATRAAPPRAGLPCRTSPCRALPFLQFTTTNISATTIIPHTRLYAEEQQLCSLCLSQAGHWIPPCYHHNTYTQPSWSLVAGTWRDGHWCALASYVQCLVGTAEGGTVRTTGSCSQGEVERSKA